ncbi:MAG: UDP-N-acetylglucosamine 2-epimerase [Bacteroidales bacterium]
MRKICVVTTSRAEYGLLFWLMKEIQDDPELQLQLVVTGTHLSPEFGSTVNLIRDDGFRIDRQFDLQLMGDKPTDITHALAVALEGFASAFHTLNPDIVVLLGDRFEILGAASAALIANLPVAHIHGGELSLGAIDDSIRHAVTKMSHLHFTAAPEYRDRVIRMGEPPERVFLVGGMGIDNILRLRFLERADFEKAIGFTLGARNLLVTYHPETTDPSAVASQVEELLKALSQLTDTHLIFTHPSADIGYKAIVERIQEFVRLNNGRAILIKSMGQLNYLSALRHVDAVVGNSSSGLIEAPGFHIGTLNIGHRQDGRLRAASVIDCECEEQAILNGLKTIYSDAFRSQLPGVTNPYGEGGAAGKVVAILKSVEINQLIPKTFFDN